MHLKTNWCPPLLIIANPYLHTYLICERITG